MTDPKMPPNVRVKQLKWEWVYEYGCVARAKTNIGTYSLHADEDSASSRMLLYLHLTKDGDCTKYAIEIAAEYLDDDEMKCLAQADYTARILSALEVVGDDGAYVRGQRQMRRRIYDACALPDMYPGSWTREGEAMQAMLLERIRSAEVDRAALTKGSTDDRT